MLDSLWSSSSLSVAVTRGELVNIHASRAAADVATAAAGLTNLFGVIVVVLSGSWARVADIIWNLYRDGAPGISPGATCKERQRRAKCGTRSFFVCLGSCHGNKPV